MSENEATKPQESGAQDFAALFQARADLIRTIDADVDRLLEMSSELKAKAREVGAALDFQYTELVRTLEKLTAAGRPASEAPRRRGPALGKPRRYQLFWKSGEPVLDEQGEPILFKTKVRILRGPLYETIIGKKIKDVQLIDTLTGNAVVHGELGLGPAPGAPKRR